MSYAYDLDETRTVRLLAELRQRLRLVIRGRCTYCGQKRSAPRCKLPERHSFRVAWAVNRWWWRQHRKLA